MEESQHLADAMPDGRPWPRISVVTPSYNQARFVEETIRSVLLQGYPNLEYVVMDGGSTDGTVEILRKYERFLSFLHIGPDGGQSAAIALGFRRATGEILAWLNSDDRYQPGALGRVGEYFARHPRMAFIHSDVNHVDEKGELIARSFVVGSCRTVTANLGWHNWIQPGCFWRRRAYDECGGLDESLQFCMDRDLFLRLAAVGTSRRLSGPPTADFRHHSLAKSSTLLRVSEEENARLIAKYSSPILRRLPQALHLHWRWASYIARGREWVHTRWGVEL